MPPNSEAPEKGSGWGGCGASLFGGMAPHPASVSGRSPVSEPPPLTLPYPSKPPAPQQQPFSHRPPQSIWDLPGPGEGAEVTRHSPLQETKPLNSIWNEPMPASHHQSESPREMIHQHKDIHEPTEETNMNEELDHSESNSQDLEPETSEIDPTTFVKP